MWQARREVEGDEVEGVGGERVVAEWCRFVFLDKDAEEGRVLTR